MHKYTQTHTISQAIQILEVASQTSNHPGKRVISPASLLLSEVQRSPPYPPPLPGPELEEGALSIAGNKK